MCYLLAFSVKDSIHHSMPDVKCTVTITIDTSGFVINSSLSGNLPALYVKELNYYLSRLSGLKPLEQDGEKMLSNISIDIFTTTDTLKSNSINSIKYKYVAANIFAADSVKNIVLNHLDTIPVRIQIEAKFPGGARAWQTYLERNLNSNVPVDHRAPNGIYTVIVSFLVDESGNISEVKALTNPGYGTAEEAVRIIKSGPPWIPAVQDGKNVIYRQKQSITFQVSGG